MVLGAAAVALSMCVQLMPMMPFLSGLAGAWAALFILWLPLFWAIIIFYARFLTRRRTLLLLTAVLSLAAWPVLFRFGRHLTFLAGFRIALDRQISEPGLRLMDERARAALETSEREGIILINPDHGYIGGKAEALLWSEIQTVPGFKNLPPYPKVIVNESYFELAWGGSLIGHWGVRIQHPKVTRRSSDVEFLETGPDMALYESRW